MGRKFGNAALWGAGATFGGDLVNVSVVVHDVEEMLIVTRMRCADFDAEGDAMCVYLGLSLFVCREVEDWRLKLRCSYAVFVFEGISWV